MYNRYHWKKVPATTSSNHFPLICWVTKIWGFKTLILNLSKRPVTLHAVVSIKDVKIWKALKVLGKKNFAVKLYQKQKNKKRHLASKYFAAPVYFIGIFLVISCRKTPWTFCLNTHVWLTKKFCSTKAENSFRNFCLSGWKKKKSSKKIRHRHFVLAGQQNLLRKPQK